MDILLIILAMLCAFFAIIGSIVPAIPGPILAYFSLWLARWSGYGEFSDKYMIIMAVITAIVFVADYYLPPLITKKMGGSKYASTGSVIGMIIGMFLTPIGMLLGMLLGAFVGELMFAKKSGGQSIVAAIGAFLGFLAGTGIKLMLCGYIIFDIVHKAFFA